MVWTASFWCSFFELTIIFPNFLLPTMTLHKLWTTFTFKWASSSMWYQAWDSSDTGSTIRFFLPLVKELLSSWLGFLFNTGSHRTKLLVRISLLFRTPLITLLASAVEISNTSFMFPTTTVSDLMSFGAFLEFY